MGVDESVDSLALEDYDYYEDVTKKRWFFKITIYHIWYIYLLLLVITNLFKK
jgi:hypothetical protein